ncbi:Spc24 subunit of Ndc80-domain-containing protein [Limtongia smithiae]|uniref:Spc24 subunit of Ndc80-domain-containing protein n=1 Tax=Limtongia smithiae TaxID=1125753 RepID=UPI0034CD0D39
MALKTKTDSLASLISSTTENFQIAPDVQAITRISDHIRILKAARDLERDQQLDILRSLSRRLELAKAAVSTPASPRRRQHTSRMLALDRQKFALAKNINDLESAYNSSEATLARLNDELNKLRNEDVLETESGAQQDSTVAVNMLTLLSCRLLLKVYRSLGISLEPDDAGGYSRAVVWSQQSNDIHTLNLDKSYSNYFIANYLWDMM